MAFKLDQGNEISSVNSTTVLLAGGGVFIGAWENVVDFNTVSVAILGSTSTDGTLFFDLSTDNGVTFTSVPSSVGDTTFAVPRILNAVEDYIRIRYINGTTPQAGTWSLRTKYAVNQQIALLSNIDGFINGETPTQVVRSVITSKQPNGTFKNEVHNGVAINSTANLGIGGVFTSDWIDTDGYNVIETFISSDVISATGGIVFQFTGDLSGTPVVRTSETFEFGVNELANGDVNIFIYPKMVGFRIVYTNGAIAQTTFLLQIDLKTNGIVAGRLDATLSGSEDAALTRSVITGQDPDEVFRNVVTTRNGNLDVSIGDADLGFNAIVTPGGGLKIAEQTHLLGSPFGGAALSADEWMVTLVGSGTQDASLPGELAMQTGTTSNSSVTIQTESIARFIPANYNTTHHAVTLPDGAVYVSNNSRKWGAINFVSGNGVYYEIDSGIWYVVHCINGVHTRVIQSSWNGTGASSFPTNSTNANVYEIEYNAGSIIYRVNGSVIHRSTLLSTPYANSIHFPAGMSNTNTGGSTTDVALKLRAAAIYTLGKGKGDPRPKYIAGTTAGTLLKTGPGHLGKVIFARAGGGGGSATILIYDAVSATNQVGRIDISRDDTIAVDYDFIYSMGLYVAISGTGTLGTTITFD